jgi:hypothetical protein
MRDEGESITVNTTSAIITDKEEIITLNTTPGLARDDDKFIKVNTMSHDKFITYNTTSVSAAVNTIWTSWSVSQGQGQGQEIGKEISSHRSLDITTSPTTVQGYITWISNTVTRTVNDDTTVYMDNNSNLSPDPGLMQTSTTYRYPVEDEFTGLHTIRAMDIGDSGHWLDLTLFVLGVIIVLTVIGNLLVCLAIKFDTRLHHMTYYFLVSMAMLHILLAALLMTPTIFSILTGKMRLSYPMSQSLPPS